MTLRRPNSDHSQRARRRAEARSVRRAKNLLASVGEEAWQPPVQVRVDAEESEKPPAASGEGDIAREATEKTGE